MNIKIKREITKRKEKERLLEQQSRFAMMGEMIGAISHQWKQPLNILSILMTNLSMLEEDELTLKELLEEIEDAVEKSTNQIQFMSDTINDFNNFFKPNKTKINFDIIKAVAEVSNLTYAQLKHNHVDLEVLLYRDENIYTLSSDKNSMYNKVFAYGYPNEFKQVILNLITNAKDAILAHIKNDTESSEVKNGIKIEIYSRDESVFIKISDSGGGIPETILNRIFEPYFTTKESSGGTGIGLYLAKTIIEKNMEGKLSVQNSALGAEFLIELNRGN